MAVRALSYGVLVCSLVMMQFSRSQAAKYAGEPFHIGVGARALGMGGAFSAVADDVTSGFWNPAGLALTPNYQVALMHSETFGSLLDHDYVALAVPLKHEPVSGAAGITLTRLGGGGIKLTDWDAGLRRPVVEKEAGHADYQLILSYATRKSERLRLGASAKVIYKDIADNSAFGIGADLGIQYDVRDNIKAALVVRDATTTLLSYDTGSKESIFPTVIPGIMYRRHSGEFEFVASAAADLKLEHYQTSAQYWLGSLSADSHLGLEIGYRNVAFGRIGSDIGRLCLGCGIIVAPAELDIAYMRHTEIDDSFRISILYNLD